MEETAVQNPGFLIRLFFTNWDVAIVYFMLFVLKINELKTSTDVGCTRKG